MIILGSQLLNTPVMGLQTGSELARTKRAIIDPATLTIIAYEVDGPLLSQKPSLIRLVDIREISDMGLIVDSSDEFVSPSDVIKLHEVYQLHFLLLGMSVLDEQRRKLGKIIDYTIETLGFTVQQLTVKRPLLQSFTDTELLIHRQQIIEINNEAIVIQADAKLTEPTLEQVGGSYVNPFRKTNTASLIE